MGAPRVIECDSFKNKRPKHRCKPNECGKSGPSLSVLDLFQRALRYSRFFCDFDSRFSFALCLDPLSEITKVLFPWALRLGTSGMNRFVGLLVYLSYSRDLIRCVQFLTSILEDISQFKQQTV